MHEIRSLTAKNTYSHGVHCTYMVYTVLPPLLYDVGSQMSLAIRLTPHFCFKEFLLWFRVAMLQLYYPSEVGLRLTLKYETPTPPPPVGTPLCIYVVYTGYFVVVISMMITVVLYNHQEFSLLSLLIPAFQDGKLTLL